MSSTEAMKNLGETLVNLRYGKTSQTYPEVEEAAGGMGLSTKVLKNLEEGTRKDISVDEIFAISQYYDVPPSYIFDILKGQQVKEPIPAGGASIGQRPATGEGDEDE
jgi:transcriptional regulator with XRE-family HTH domain